MQKTVTQGDKYLHFKGGVYEVIEEVFDADSNQQVILYKDKDGRKFTSSYQRWFSEVNGQPRFELQIPFKREGFEPIFDLEDKEVGEAALLSQELSDKTSKTFSGNRLGHIRKPSGIGFIWGEIGKDYVVWINDELSILDEAVFKSSYHFEREMLCDTYKKHQTPKDENTLLSDFVSFIKEWGQISQNTDGSYHVVIPMGHPFDRAGEFKTHLSYDRVFNQLYIHFENDTIQETGGFTTLDCIAESISDFPNILTLLSKSLETKCIQEKASSLKQQILDFVDKQPRVKFLKQSGDQYFLKIKNKHLPEDHPWKKIKHVVLVFVKHVDQRETYSVAFNLLAAKSLYLMEEEKVETLEQFEVFFKKSGLYELRNFKKEGLKDKPGDESFTSRECGCELNVEVLPNPVLKGHLILTTTGCEKWYKNH